MRACLDARRAGPLKQVGVTVAGERRIRRRSTIQNPAIKPGSCSWDRFSSAVCPGNRPGETLRLWRGHRN